MQIHFSFFSQFLSNISSYGCVRDNIVKKFILRWLICNIRYQHGLIHTYIEDDSLVCPVTKICENCLFRRDLVRSKSKQPEEFVCNKIGTNIWEKISIQSIETLGALLSLLWAINARQYNLAIWQMLLLLTFSAVVLGLVFPLLAKIRFLQAMCNRNLCVKVLPFWFLFLLWVEGIWSFVS